MALITRFEELPSVSTRRRHSEVQCGYRTVRANSTVMLQLDTYGSAEREVPGKTSQSIQLNLEGAGQLVEIIRKVFPELRVVQQTVGS